MSRFVAVVAALLGAAVAWAAEAPAFGQPHGRGAVETDLEAWFTANGGELDGIAVHQFQGMGRGLRATKELLGEEQVLSVPLELAISRQTALASADSPTVRSVLEGVASEGDVIALFLMREKARGADSFWAPYLASLPPAIPQAAFLPAEVLRETEDRLVVLQAEQRRKQVRQTLAHTTTARAQLAAGLGDEAAAWVQSDKAFEWATAVVSSRALTFRGRKYLTPIADMFNYSPHPNPRQAASGEFFLEHHKLTADRLLVLADRPTAQGDQLFEDYGDNSNSVYLEHHGFVPHENPFECVYTRVKLEPTDPLRIKRTMLFERLRLAGSPAFCLRDLEDWPPELYQWLVASTLPEATLDKCLDVLPAARNAPVAMAKLKTCPAFLDYANVPHAHLVPTEWRPSGPQLALLLPALEAKKAGFATTAAADAAVLAASDDGSARLSAERRLAVAYRLGQKQVTDRLVGELRSASESCQSDDVEPDAPAAAEAAAERDSGVACTPWEDGQECDLPRILDQFNEWVDQAAFPVNKIRGAAIPGMRIGAVATEGVTKGEPYLAVPTTVILDAQSAFRSPPLDPLIKFFTKSREADFFVVLMHLLHEALVLGQSSVYWPYIQVLPSLAETHPPLVYSDGELELLRGSEVRNSTVSYRKRVLRHWEALKNVQADVDQVFQSAGGLTFEQFRWAHYILDSRCIWWEGGRHLVPLLDLINCAEGPDPDAVHSTAMEDFGPLGLAASTNAAWDFKEGDQVFENYGQSNHIYLSYHGFVLDQNTHDCVEITLDIGREDVARLGVDSKALRARMREFNFFSAVQSFCVAGPRNPWHEDARLLAFLALKHGRATTNPTDVLGDFKAVIEGRLAGYGEAPAGDADHPAVKLVREERGLLTALVADLDAFSP